MPRKTTGLGVDAHNPTCPTSPQWDPSDAESGSVYFGGRASDEHSDAYNADDALGIGAPAAKGYVLQRTIAYRPWWRRLCGSPTPLHLGGFELEKPRLRRSGARLNRQALFATQQGARMHMYLHTPCAHGDRDFPAFAVSCSPMRTYMCILCMRMS